MINHHTKTIIAIMCAVLAALIAIIFVYPYDPVETDVLNKFAPMSIAHPLGTDHLGRDELARLMFGAKMSLFSVLLISTSVTILSFATGLIAGYMGGLIDAVFMRICDVFLVFPTFIFALFLVGMLGTGLANVIIAIVITHWAWYARMVRNITLEDKEKGFVMAAKVAGTSKFSIITRHILPDVFIQMIVLVTLDLGHMLLHVSGLSFLGLGVQAPTPEWGVMINDAAPYIAAHPALLIYPGLCIFATVAFFNILGDALRDKLDPAGHI